MGNQSQLDSAKTIILNSLIGLILALGSYVILHSINPALTSLKMPQVAMIRTEELKMGGVEGNLTEWGFCGSKGEKEIFQTSCGLNTIDEKRKQCIGAKCVGIDPEVCAVSQNINYWWKGTIPDILRTLFGGSEVFCLREIYLTDGDKKEKVRIDIEETCGVIVDKGAGGIFGFFGGRKIVIGSGCINKDGHCVLNLDKGLTKKTYERKGKIILGSFNNAQCFYN
jgi:hypothetical protein